MPLCPRPPPPPSTIRTTTTTNPCFPAQLVMIPHSKNTRVSVTRKRVLWGKTPFRVNDDPEISQLDAEYDPELGQSDPIICQVCRELTKFRVAFDLERSIPQGPFFPGHCDPGVFRVQTRRKLSRRQGKWGDTQNKWRPTFTVDMSPYKTRPYRLVYH